MLRCLAYIVLSLFVCSCGFADDFEEMKLLVVISADNTAPEGAVGTASPKSIAATLTDIFWTNDETGEVEDLWEADAEGFLILNRDRILLEKDIKDLKGKSYSNFTVQLSTALTAEGKYEVKTLALEPTETDGTTVDFVVPESMTINEAKGRTITLKCQWYLTRATDDASLTDEITNPSFTIEQSEN